MQEEKASLIHYLIDLINYYKKFFGIEIANNLPCPYTKEVLK